MELLFKEQDFQLKAVHSVVKCFEGQSLKNHHFTLERINELMRKARLVASGTLEIEYILDEEIGYRNAPLQLTEDRILKNIQQVQQGNELYESQKIERPDGISSGYNLSIEMETGTGKTYTYIRTMYELHKHYGWSKFIIIVPSIAIREGVNKSFQDTQKHFQEVFGHKIAPFIYNSARPQDIESFASDNRISVMIINMQAFNAKGEDARRIYQELDQFGTRKPIDIIAQTNPILIIDEPQSVEGEKTLKSMQDFNPLFTLRYSATHKVEYNKVFRLDTLDAYQNHLVKKIQVKGINLKGSSGTSGYLYLEQISLSTTKPPYAVIEFENRGNTGIKKVMQKVGEGANLYELSGNLPAYKNQIITEINGYLNKIVVNGQDIFPGDMLNNPDYMTFRRIQIRETILSHLEKERQLFDKGIKVLSLFFIDSVDKYRIYKKDEQELGEYARIFEEEYVKACARHSFDMFQPEYNDYLYEAHPSKVHSEYMPTNYDEYLKRDEVKKIHEGYFAIDKKGKSIEPNIKRGSEDSEDISAYELIMKGKSRLLDFEEPVRFIFSHSALKEGWDNPNVFQICALKDTSTNNVTRRRQEIGRGMRLCVNKNGTRMDFEMVGNQVHEINKLTIIASESYENFANGLQHEIAESLSARPQKANSNFFLGKIVTSNSGEKYRLTQNDAEKIWKKLLVAEIIDEDDKLTISGKRIIEENKIPLPDSLESFRNSINKLLKSLYTVGQFKPENERRTITLNTNQNFKKKEFQELWDKINLKTIYEVNLDTKKLIKESKIRINALLSVSDKIYEIRTGELLRGTKEQLESGGLMQELIIERKKESLQNDSYNVNYDIVGEIEVLTGLTRLTIVEILKHIEEVKFALLQKNPEEFILKCSKLINEAKAKLIINNIIYHKTEERYDARTVFSNTKSAIRDSELFKKHIYDYISTDSNTEKEFARVLDKSTEVIVYAKLPQSFYIATPIAKYTPDWAIVFDTNKVRHIYFVAETKGSESDMELRVIEEIKIHCAEQHFEEISGTEVKFIKVASYDTLLEIAELHHSL